MSLLLMAARARMNHRAGLTDPYWNNVISLLHFDGSNGSTVFTDAVIANTWSPDTDAKISTAQSMFGGASGSFLGTTLGQTYIKFAAATPWGFPGAFTVEGWVYRTAAATLQVCNIIQVGGSGYPGGLGICVYNNALRVSAPYVANYIQGTTNSIPINQWTHIAVTRDASNVLRAFVGGVLDKSVTCTATFSPPAGAASCVGGGDAVSQAYPINGYLDEIRITKGVARYTSNFTPPSAPFPNG